MDKNFLIMSSVVRAKTVMILGKFLDLRRRQEEKSSDLKSMLLVGSTQSPSAVFRRYSVSKSLKESSCARKNTIALLKLISIYLRLY